ncbi:hypothetical protein JCM14036_18370 [Desulfotomaculum defluvii]
MNSLELKKRARKILGVSEEADIEDIRSAYRQLAKKYHPDLNDNDPSMCENFKFISEAYEILTKYRNRDRYTIDKNGARPTGEPPLDDKAYFEWWKERFGDLL